MAAYLLLRPLALIPTRPSLAELQAPWGACYCACVVPPPVGRPTPGHRRLSVWPCVFPRTSNWLVLPPCLVFCVLNPNPAPNGSPSALLSSRAGGGGAALHRGGQPAFGSPSAHPRPLPPHPGGPASWTWFPPSLGGMQLPRAACEEYMGRNDSNFSSV